MIASAIVEITVTPPQERPQVHGVIAQLSVPRDTKSGPAAIRARRRHAMDWMELEQGAE